MKKSKVMSKSLAVKQPFTIGNKTLEEVNEYSYLGQLLRQIEATRKNSEEELAWHGERIGITLK